MAELVAVVSVWQGVFFGHCSRDRRDVPVCCSRRALRGRTCPHRILPSPKNKCARKKEPARKHKTRRREGEGKKEKEQRGYDERSSEQRASRHCVRAAICCLPLFAVGGRSVVRWQQQQQFGRRPTGGVVEEKRAVCGRERGLQKRERKKQRGKATCDVSKAGGLVLHSPASAASSSVSLDLATSQARSTL